MTNANDIVSDKLKSILHAAYIAIVAYSNMFFRRNYVVIVFLLT